MASSKIGNQFNQHQQQMFNSGSGGGGSGVMPRNSSSRPPPPPQQRNSQHSNPLMTNNYCNNMESQYQNSQQIGNSLLQNVPGYLSSPAIHAAVYAASNTSNHSGGNHGDVHRNDGANNFATIRTTSIVTKQQKEHMQVNLLYKMQFCLYVYFICHTM